MLHAAARSAALTAHCAHAAYAAALHAELGRWVPHKLPLPRRTLPTFYAPSTRACLGGGLRIYTAPLPSLNLSVYHSIWRFEKTFQVHHTSCGKHSSIPV